MNVFPKVFVASALAFTSLASHAVAEEVLNVTADILAEEFRDNQLKAEQKYKNTSFNLIGAVESVRKFSDGQVYIELTSDVVPVTVVNAYLIPEAIEKAINLDNGDEVTLHCIGADKPAIVDAYSCDILE